MKRFASVTRLKSDRVVYYKDLHAAVWPAVLARIKASNLSNYSIYLKEIDGDYFLFSYLEYTGSDFEKDMENMANDEVTQRWWKETDPCQQPLTDIAGTGKIWSDMEEVFHLP